MSPEDHQIKRSIQLAPSWLSRLGPEFDQDYMVALRAYLLERRNTGATIYPPPALWFNALNRTPFDQVRVVILGQDPYHGPGQAHGLCFSVQSGLPVPPSLKNIFKEREQDLGLPAPDDGCLEAWADRGVLLLNAVLTVERGSAGAHQNQGWEQFTDVVIRVLNAEREGLVFMLWGGYALKKGSIIDRDRHCVLTAPHPSPLSAHRGFLGCRHFSKANQYLESCGTPALDWSLPQDPPSRGLQEATGE